MTYLPRRSKRGWISYPTNSLIIRMISGPWLRLMFERMKNTSTAPEHCWNNGIAVELGVQRQDRMVCPTGI